MGQMLVVVNEEIDLRLDGLHKGAELECRPFRLRERVEEDAFHLHAIREIVLDKELALEVKVIARSRNRLHEGLMQMNATKVVENIVLVRFVDRVGIELLLPIAIVTGPHLDRRRSRIAAPRHDNAPVSWDDGVDVAGRLIAMKAAAGLDRVELDEKMGGGHVYEGRGRGGKFPGKVRRRFITTTAKRNSRWKQPNGKV